MKKKFLILIMLMMLVFLGGGAPKATFASTGDNKITITYDFNAERLEKYLPNGMSASLKNYSKTYNLNDIVDFPQISSAILKRYDYVWTKNGETIDFSNFRATENVRLTVSWTPIEYDIYYMLSDDERNEISNLKLREKYSVEKSVHFYRPERSNYIFLDWYSSRDYLSDDIQMYTDNRTIGDKVLYAKWKPIEYRINYHTDAENELNPTSYNVESETFVLQPACKVGHIFKGWFYDVNCTRSATKISKGDYGNINLYPLWELEKYNVTYVLPDGTTQVVETEYGKNAEKPKYNTNIFTVLTYSKSTRNITGDETIKVKTLSIWWVYMLAVVVIVGIVTSVILIKRNREKNLHKLKQIYQSNLNHKKRKIR